MSDVVIRNGDLEQLAAEVRAATGRSAVTMRVAGSTYEKIQAAGVTVPPDLVVVDHDGNLLRDRLT